MDYTTKLPITSKDSNTPTTHKRSISNLSPTSPTPSVKHQNMENQSEQLIVPEIKCNDTAEPDPITSVEGNASLQKALGPLITEFHHLRESVDTVHADYANLKQTISNQKITKTQDLSHKKACERKIENFGTDCQSWNHSN